MNIAYIHSVLVYYKLCHPYRPLSNMLIGRDPHSTLFLLVVFSLLVHKTSQFAMCCSCGDNAYVTRSQNSWLDCRTCGLYLNCACNDNYWEDSGGVGSMGGVCRQCTDCTDPERRGISPCTYYENANCPLCTQCGEGQFQSRGCKEGWESFDRLCQNCDPPCDDLSYWSYTFELLGRTYTQLYYQQQDCANGNQPQNRKCEGCDTCFDDTYASRQCREGGITNNVICSQCTPHCQLPQYETTPCWHGSNRECTNCTNCLSTQFAAVDCQEDNNATQDRQCAPCSPPCTGDTYESTPCGGNSPIDRECSPCQACPAAQYQAVDCRANGNATQNRECRNCTERSYVHALVEQKLTCCEKDGKTAVYRSISMDVGVETDIRDFAQSVVTGMIYEIIFTEFIIAQS